MNNLQLYKKRIFQYYRDNRFNAPLEKSTHKAEVFGKLCGDHCIMTAQLDGLIITKLHFNVKGCIVATACANILAEYLQQQPLVTLQKLDQQVFIAKIVDLPIDDLRLECAVLAFNLCKKQFAV